MTEARVHSGVGSTKGQLVTLIVPDYDYYKQGGMTDQPQEIMKILVRKVLKKNTQNGQTYHLGEGGLLVDLRKRLFGWIAS